MLRVTVELLPGGHESGRTTLATVDIDNVGVDSLADYRVRVTDESAHLPTDKGEVTDYARWAAPVLDLMARAIAITLTGREGLPKRPTRLRIPFREHAGIRFVRMSDIPEPTRSAFRRRMRGAECPLIASEPNPRDVVYAQDWRTLLGDCA